MREFERAEQFLAKIENKYQEALSDIVDNGITDEYFNEESLKPQCENTILIIQELVDKATPKKPVNKGGWKAPVLCPNCKADLSYLDDYGNFRVRNNLSHCVCDQKLDWSDWG